MVAVYRYHQLIAKHMVQMDVHHVDMDSIYKKIYASNALIPRMDLYANNKIENYICHLCFY